MRVIKDFFVLQGAFLPTMADNDIPELTETFNGGAFYGNTDFNELLIHFSSTLDCPKGHRNVINEVRELL